MPSPAERTALAAARVHDLLNRSSSDSLASLPGARRQDLDLLFEIRAKGFREILFTVTLATLMDSSYRSSRDLYACNPRPLYEQGIRPVLESNRIPCGQSGPLNVAKAARALDAPWAAQRRPPAAAQAVLRLVDYIEVSTDKANLLAEAMAFKFTSEAAAVAQLAVEAPPTARVATLATLCREMITQVPDGGNTPQRICGYLLHQMHGQAYLVEGQDDSASTTNATSKKPGDLSVTDREGRLLSIYEVTVKPFDGQRVSECTQSLLAYTAATGQDVTTVRVLCRPQDAPVAASPAGGAALLAVGEDCGVTYEYIDVFEWITVVLCLLDTASRIAFFERLQAYVNLTNTRLAVKQWFRDEAPSLMQTAD